MDDIRECDTEPAPPPTQEANRLAAARVWLHATSNGPDLWDAMASAAVLKALDGAHLNIEARGWLCERTQLGDRVHKDWAIACLAQLERMK